LRTKYQRIADLNQLIDPSTTNMIDTYVLLRSYDNSYRTWSIYDGRSQTKPNPPTVSELTTLFESLESKKSISDQVIYRPVKYKLLFGDLANSEVQARFVVTKTANSTMSETEIQNRIVNLITKYFNVDNWDFGDRFYFSELSTYVMSQLSPNLVTFVIVPVQEDQTYGSLQEIKSESDEIFISSATVSDVEVIDAITAGRLKSQGAVVTSVTAANTGIQSGASTSTSTNGGLSY